MNNVHGWLFVDKPYGLSSNHVLQKIRRHFGKVKAGHVGTLDPLATGLLPVALGEATKTISFLEPKRKTYLFDVTWGESRATGDFEGEVIERSDCRPTAVDIESAVPQFIGRISQTPPIYSAIKIQGVPAYRKARRGDEFIMSPRFVDVFSLSVKEVLPDKATFEVVSGSGLYVRTLAEDLAEAVGTVGFVSSLRRTCLGPFSEKHMATLEKILEIEGGFGVQHHMHSVDVVLDDIPVVVLNEEISLRLRQGQRVYCDIDVPPSSTEDGVLCKEESGRLLGFVTIKDAIIHPKRMFNF